MENSLVLCMGSNMRPSLFTAGPAQAGLRPCAPVPLRGQRARQRHLRRDQGLCERGEGGFHACDLGPGLTLIPPLGWRTQAECFPAVRLHRAPRTPWSTACSSSRAVSQWVGGALGKQLPCRVAWPGRQLSEAARTAPAVGALAAYYL